MTKQLLYLLTALAVLTAAAPTARAQVGVGTTTPDSKAALDISSTSKGLLIPRLDSAQRAAITPPPDGLMVFQTDGRRGFWYAVTGTWYFIPDKTRSGDNLGSHTATQNLNLADKLLVGNGGSSGLAISSTGSVGIGTSTPAALLHVADGNTAFTASGDLPATPAPLGVSGAGRRWLWYADKAAFRAGYANGTQWDEANVGAYSVALGNSPTASGAHAIAAGDGTSASGSGAVALGSGARASGTGALAAGASAAASGDDALALGPSALATGVAAVAVGPSRAKGFFGMALGLQCSANADFSTALGKNARALHRGALTLGDASASFSSDSVYSTASNQLTARYIGGFRLGTNLALTTGLFLTSAGQLGLNTSSPAATLHVAGSTSTVRMDGLAGTGTRLVTADASGNLSATASLADNLGNHTATQNLNLQGNALTGTGSDLGAAVGLGVRADGGLNLGQNTSGHDLRLGYQAGASLGNGNANHLVGYQAGAASTVGNFNYFSGYQAGQFNTNSVYNTFIGYQAGRSADGSLTLALGAQAGETQTGSQNILIGYQAGHSTTGSQNVLLGTQAGEAQTGSSNVFVGGNTGRVNTGSLLTFLGHGAGERNTNGSANLLVGYSAGSFTTTGSANVFVGNDAGAANTTGNSNTALGSNAGPANGSTNLNNATAIGSYAKVSQSNSLVLGNGANVGIGTTAPATTLHVAGSGSTVRLEGLAGTDTRLVTADASGNLGSATTASLGDNLGNHTATTNLNLGSYKLVGNGGSTGLSIGSTGAVSADGALNTGGTATLTGIKLPNAFDPNTAYVGSAGNYLSFGHTGASEDFIGYKNNTFYFKDSPGGGDTADPSVNVGGNLTVGGLAGTGTRLLTADASGNLGSSTGTVESTTASSGLTLSGTDVRLGGTLSNSTTINIGGSGRSLTIASANGGSFAAYDFPAFSNTHLVAGFVGSSGNGAQVRFSGVGTSYVDIGQNSSGDFVVEGTNGTSRLVVQRAGNVGVGTANPQSTLDVEGTVSVKPTTGLTGGTSSSPTVLNNTSATYLGLSPSGSSNYYQLPDPAAYPGRMYVIRNNAGTSAVLVSAAGSLFAGSSSAALTSYTLNGGSSVKTVIIFSDGGNWTVGKLD